MAIYKSSFNKVKVKHPVDKQEKVKIIKEKKTKKKVNKPLICLISFLCIFVVCILPSNVFKRFFLGAFGLSVYPITMIGSFFASVNLKKQKPKVNKKYLTYLTIALVSIWFILHLILTSKLSTASYMEFLKQTYVAKSTAGGVVFSLLAYPMEKYLTIVGAYIVSAIVLAIDVGFVVDYVSVERKTEKKNEKSTFQFEELDDFMFEPEVKAEKVKEEKPKVDKTKENAKKKLGIVESDCTILSSSMPVFDFETNLSQDKPLSKKEYIMTPLEPIIEPENTKDIFGSRKPWQENVSSNFEQTIRPNAEEIKPVDNLDLEEDETSEETDNLFVEEDETEGFSTAFETSNKVEGEYSNEVENETSEEMPDEELEDISTDENEYSSTEKQEYETDLEEDYVDEYAYTRETDLGDSQDKDVVRPSVDLSRFNLPNKPNEMHKEEQIHMEDERSKQEIPPYVAPPVELLKYLENPARITDEELQDNIERLEQVLEDFKVPAKVNNVKVGPAVTRYELTMPRGISVNKIAQMSDDIAMVLASNGKIRVEAPIPGKTSVGVEVPNKQVSPVSLRELIDSDAFRNRGNPLSFVLGKDINGDIIFCNLDKMPHVLVAGSTGSGKSVCLNTMLLSMCYKAGPEDLRLVLVDPKMVEFTTYNGLPHLLIPEVITNKNMTINALDWAIKEMEHRYALFARNHVVNINEFNHSEAVKTKQEQKLPYIVIVVDELADLMLEAKREIDDRIAKLAAKARAAGIHLVLATQRPSVDVITGTVKANLPSRIAFALTNFMDSKTILDGSGAEKLLGKGDMLFKPQDKPEALRVQGAYVSNEEIYAVVEYIKQHNNPVFDDEADRLIKNPKQDNPNAGMMGTEKEIEFDPILKEALRMFIQTRQASGSMISRRYSVGFNRAGRIMDQMERAGFIGPQDGSKPRQVLITLEEYNAIFGDDE